jgi:hypothetical protein
MNPQRLSISVARPSTMARALTPSIAPARRAPIAPAIAPTIGASSTSPSVRGEVRWTRPTGVPLARSTALPSRSSVATHRRTIGSAMTPP